MSDVSRLRWRKSSRSGVDNCVEVAVLPDGGVAVRDSKDPDGPALTLSSVRWQSFVASLKKDDCGQ